MPMDRGGGRSANRGGGRSANRGGGRSANRSANRSSWDKDRDAAPRRKKKTPTQAAANVASPAPTGPDVATTPGPVRQAAVLFDRQKEQQEALARARKRRGIKPALGAVGRENSNTQRQTLG